MLCKAVAAIVLLILIMSRCFDVMYILLLCVLHYTTPHFQVLFSSQLMQYYKIKMLV